MARVVLQNTNAISTLRHVRQSTDGMLQILHKAWTKNERSIRCLSRPPWFSRRHILTQQPFAGRLWPLELMGTTPSIGAGCTVSIHGRGSVRNRRSQHRADWIPAGTIYVADADCSAHHVTSEVPQSTWAARLASPSSTGLEKTMSGLSYRGYQHATLSELGSFMLLLFASRRSHNFGTLHGHKNSAELSPGFCICRLHTGIPAQDACSVCFFTVQPVVRSGCHVSRATSQADVPFQQCFPSQLCQQEPTDPGELVLWPSFGTKSYIACTPSPCSLAHYLPTSSPGCPKRSRWGPWLQRPQRASSRSWHAKTI